MAKIITYDLQNGEENSDGYYSVVEEFTREWLVKTLPKVSDLLDGFSKFRQKKNYPNRSREAYSFELLVLGVLFLEHARDAEALTPGWGQILQRMIRDQSRYPRMEGLIKATRGWVYTISRLAHRQKYQHTDLQTMLNWLAAIGEDTQARRLSEWREYFNHPGNEAGIINRVINLARDFSMESMERLGKYTATIEQFLATEVNRKHWRYDAAFLQHTRLEYHLAMLGNAILNKENQEEFLRTKARIVILPPCMKAHNDAECKATMTENGELCAGCTPTCRVHQVTKLGEKHGFGVFIIPEEIRGYAREGEREKVGLVGVSCALTNWSGGWDAEQLGIPAQGVLLDYVGCKYHWDKKGFPTDINLDHLLNKVEPKNR